MRILTHDPFVLLHVQQSVNEERPGEGDREEEEQTGPIVVNAGGKIAITQFGQHEYGEDPEKIGNQSQR